jgi:hypothetical protein
VCSSSAFFVTQTLRGLARDGRTVIASIHQPSSEVFELFDMLFLLSGGKTVYFGQASQACEVVILYSCRCYREMPNACFGDNVIVRLTLLALLGCSSLLKAVSLARL